MSTAPLVRPLPDGPLDIVGDVHGEAEALRALLGRLGYGPDGTHPEGRRLAFVGDLVDRGPDSPGVVRWLRPLLDAGRACCALGNHELNILLGRQKPENDWFFHLADRGECREIVDCFGRLPLALERDDLRVVHACWDEEMIAAARRAADAGELYGDYRGRLDEALRLLGVGDEAAVKLARQNRNPVKLLTSGREDRAPEPFEANGKVRCERRVAWWLGYAGPLCVFGHYWRTILPGEVDAEHLFDGVPKNALLPGGAALCIDYSVGKRFRERLAAPGGPFRTQLAALRLPERTLYFDDGECLPLVAAPAASG
jgi:hypothetical protein